MLCSLNMLCDREKGANSLYKDPSRSLCILRDEAACLKRVKSELIKISELTPAYDCVSVAAMLRHITKSTSTLPTPHKRHQSDEIDSVWYGLGWKRMHRYSVLGSPDDNNVFEIPEQPRSVCVNFTREIESYFGREEGREIMSPLMRSPSENNVLLCPIHQQHREVGGGDRIKTAPPVEQLLATLESFRSSLRMKDAKLKETEEKLAKAKKELAKRSTNKTA